jgi:excinuclease ABC subunit C
MREVLTRRFTRLLREEESVSPPPQDAGDHQPLAKAPAEAESEVIESDFPAWPDLVLIDGGAGQLSATLTVLQDLGIHDLPVIGVAKGPDRDAGREHFYRPDKTSFMLEARDPVLYYVQRLRDEAHRFAIGTHRAKRSKAIGVNPLDEIPGIGPTRKKALLQSFGSAKAVGKASVTDLSGVEGVSTALAQVIFDHFNSGSK